MSSQQRAPRILIIKPSSLGDVVHGLPVLVALRRAYPDAHIAWLVASPFAALLEGHAALDEVIRFDRRRYGRMWFDPFAHAAFWRFVVAMRRRRFDWIVDLQGLIRSGLLSWFSGARRRVGFADAREGAWLAYTERVRVPDAAVHAIDRNLALLEAMGIEAGPARFDLDVPPAVRDSAGDLLRDAGLPAAGFVAVLPGARWPSKRWPTERFAALVDRLEGEGRRCVLLGAPDERDVADELLRDCESRPADLVGRTSLPQLVAVLARASGAVCCDSGPMHIAAALGVPLVAVFGPTNPERTGPYGAAGGVARYAVPCAPCFRRRCPLGHHDCMQRLEVDAVAAKVREIPPVARTPAQLAQRD